MKLSDTFKKIYEDYLKEETLLSFKKDEGKLLTNLLEAVEKRDKALLSSSGANTTNPNCHQMCHVKERITIKSKMEGSI